MEEVKDNRELLKGQRCKIEEFNGESSGKRKRN